MLSVGKCLDHLHRAADLRVRLWAPLISEPIFAVLLFLLWRRQDRFFVLELDYRVGPKQVRQAGWNVADLVTGRFGPPTSQSLVRRGVGARLDFEDRGCHRSFFRPAHEPVHADVRLVGDRKQRFHPRQPVALGGQDLRQGRAIDAYRRRESGADSACCGR